LGDRGLFWKCLRRNEGDEPKVCLDVRNKCLDDFTKTKDLHYFLGTTQVNHSRSPNPFIIIDTFNPKKKFN
jgi:hypothetical protein